MKHKHVQKDFFKRSLIKKTEARRLALKALQNNGLARREPLRAKHVPATACRNRCTLTGRPRGVHNLYFKISRLMIRELASKGLLPGLKKASW